MSVKCEADMGDAEETMEEPMDAFREQRVEGRAPKALGAIAGFYANALCIFALLCLGIVSFSACISTQLSLVLGNEILQNVPFWQVERLPFFLGGVLAAVALFLLVFRLWKSSEMVSERPLLIICLVAGLVVGMWWILIQDTVDSRFDDARFLIQWARDASHGDWSQFSAPTNRLLDALRAGETTRFFFRRPALYLSLYPYQTGFLYYLVGAFCIFGSESMVPVQVINLIANQASIALIYLAGRHFLPDKRSRLILIVLLGLCVPSYFFATWIYGNSIGLMFGCLFVFLQTLALRAERTRDILSYIAASVPALALTLVFKSTFLLFALASLVVWVGVALNRRSVAGVASMLACVVIANALAGMPARAFERQTGIDLGKGTSKLSLVAMGLSSEERSPGWWDFTVIDTYCRAYGDQDTQSALAKESLASAVGNLASNPGHAAKFLFNKLRSEWTDPTYGLFWANSTDITSSMQPFDASAYLGEPPYVFTCLLDGYQTIVFVGAFASAFHFWRNRRRGVSAQLLLWETIFLSGFACYMLWEAKALYILPFAMLILPLSADGLARIFDKVEPVLGGLPGNMVGGTKTTGGPKRPDLA